MSETFAGGCACGAIRYACAAAPQMSFACHCRDCQRASGTAFTSILLVAANTFRLEQGEPRYFITVGDSGGKVYRGFCADCGSPVTAKLSNYPDVVGVTASSLDDPRPYRPMMHLYTSSAQPWDHIEPALLRHSKGPGTAV